jgi:hypothetical protein
VQSLDEAHSSPGLHAASGSGHAEECVTLVLFGNQIGLAQVRSIGAIQPYRMLSVIRLLWVLFQGGCRTGMAKMTNAYDLPARQVVLVLFCIC